MTVGNQAVLDGFFGQSSLAGYALAHADNTVVVDPDTDPVIASFPGTCIPHLLELHASGRFPIERLIAAFPYGDVNDALVQQHSGEVIKPVLTW